MPPHHRITAPPHHHITVLVSHLPCPLPPSLSVICLAPCHQTSLSFALPPTTASLRHCITVPPHHRATTSPRHNVTASPRHHVTVLVSHLPCPLPPSQSVICLAPCHQTSQSFALPPTTASLHHCATASLCHHITALVSHLPCPLPPSQSVICLAPCHQTSQSFALPPTTTSLHHCATASPCHCVTTSPCHCISQSFALPPATKPVSHLPCPLPPNQSVICLAPYHHITASPCHCVTASPHHRATASPRHHVSQSFALPPATKPVSHLPCLLLPNQSVICLAPTTASPCHRITTLLHHHITMSLCHCITASPC